MGRTCTVCTHDEHHVINVALVSRESYRNIAQRYDVSVYALKRHSEEHIPELLLKARDAVESAEADDLLAELKAEKQDIQRLKDLAEEGEDYRTALLAVDKALKALELQARVAQLVDSSTTVNVALVEHPDYQKLEDVLTRALEPYPAACYAVADAIKEIAG